jgi:hypothetical protein
MVANEQHTNALSNDYQYIMIDTGATTALPARLKEDNLTPFHQDM